MNQFISKFNNFTIQDEKGKSYVLMVQRAIYQSLPGDRPSKNPIENTIIESEDFKLFVEKQQQKLAMEQAKIQEEQKKEKEKLEALQNYEIKKVEEAEEDIIRRGATEEGMNSGAANQNASVNVEKNQEQVKKEEATVSANTTPVA